MNPDPDDITGDEQSLLADLASALGRDRMPSGLAERAEGLAAWFDVDRELNAILEEPSSELVGTRGDATQSMVFATADGAVEAELELDDLRVAGQLISGDADRAHLVSSDGNTIATAAIDVVGRFELAAAAPGPHRIGLVSTSGATVNTDWFVLTSTSTKD